MKISKFYNEELVDYASYSTLRMIGSVIDGMKNSHRKVIATVSARNVVKESKVSQLASQVAQDQEYLHGDVSLQGVIVNLAANYLGTNNMNMLEPAGNFGTRFTPEASAPRYIYTHKSKYFDYLFNKDDNEILIKQTFEGHKIEPKFYLPSLPMLLVNGSEGMATGFAQKILPRDPKNVEKYLKNKLTNKKNSSKLLNPQYAGFKGTIKSTGEEGSWEIIGLFERTTKTKIRITEVPVGYSLKGYIKVLDRLEEDSFIINYTDMSEDDNFLFEVTMKRDILGSLSDEKILEKFKLIKRVTENYTTIDANNRVRVFNNVGEIFDYYYDVKVEYLIKRIKYKIGKIEYEIRRLASTYLFIKAIVDDKLIINKRKKAEIEKDLESFEKISKEDGSYDYLLRMPIHSLTKEKMEELMNKIKGKKEELDYYKKTTPEMEWLKDLEK